ncbi:MAG: hypothetical protein AB4042_15685, partial [Leptolyngbyaceae cyanobacterium]
MTLHSHLPLLPSDSPDTESEARSCALFDRSDVTYIQDVEGAYHLFIWQCPSLPGLYSEQLPQAPSQPYTRLEEYGFQPVAIAPYLDCVRQCISEQSPTWLRCPIQIRDRYFLFELLLSPILVPNGSPKQVVVLGRCVCPVDETEANTLANNLSESVAHSPFNHYQDLLSDIAWNIRRTLDLDTIWRHTEECLCNALNARRCLIYVYQANEPRLTLVAEYQQDS